MRKMLLIMNPYSGQRKGQRYLAQIIELFNRADFEVITYMTACQGDAKVVVQRYVNTVDVVVCCGGDGTFNETAAGILESGVDVPIGYIPAGSTNDFATSLKLPGTILKAAKNIIEGKARRVDMGSFNGRQFSYVASFGAFTRASYATPQNVKNVLGHAAYVLSGIQEVARIKRQHVRFELGDGTVVEDDFIFGAVSNSTSVAGILTLSDKYVDMSDGQLELLLIRPPKDVAELANCIDALLKKHYNNPMITFLSTDRVKILPPADMDWTLDGEQQTGSGEIHVECLAGAISIICPEGNQMINTTLCYITRGNDVLMLHRVKKKNDINKDKWIGIGGKFEEGETPDECLLREAWEETGLTLTNWQCRGVVTFLTDELSQGEFMYLFTCDGFTGDLKVCEEGDLQWVSRDFLDALPKWEGDAIFLKLLWENAPFFLLKLRYIGSTLVEAVLDGKKLQKNALGEWA